jgi:hypothetical protein
MGKGKPLPVPGFVVYLLLSDLELNCTPNGIAPVTVTAGTFDSSVGTTTVVQPDVMVASHATNPEANA